MDFMVDNGMVVVRARALQKQSAKKLQEDSF